LLKRFDLFGPPGVVFSMVAAQGALIHKVVGYQAPTDFLASLGKARIR